MAEQFFEEHVEAAVRDYYLGVVLHELAEQSLPSPFEAAGDRVEFAKR